MAYVLEISVMFRKDLRKMHGFGIKNLNFTDTMKFWITLILLFMISIYTVYWDVLNGNSIRWWSEWFGSSQAVRMGTEFWMAVYMGTCGMTLTYSCSTLMPLHAVALGGRQMCGTLDSHVSIFVACGWQTSLYDFKVLC